MRFTQCTQWMNSLVPSCMSQYIFTRPFLACGEGCGLKTTSALAMYAKQVLYILRKITKTLSFPPVMQCHVQIIWYYSTACSMLWRRGMGNGQIWGNWENPVLVLQIILYITSAHKSTHSCSNGRTGMIPCTTTQSAKVLATDMTMQTGLTGKQLVTPYG